MIITMETFTGKITRIIEHTPLIRSFQVTKPATFSFIPGQFASLGLPYPLEGKMQRRSMSFSSSPLQTDHVEFTVKKSGLFTTELFELRVGNDLTVTGPFGDDLLFTESSPKQQVFIAGGTGVTPFMSALRYVAAKKLTHEITLLYGCPESKAILFHDELTLMSTENKNLHIVFTIDKPEKNWHGEVGFITPAMIKKYIDLEQEYLWSICGPPPLVSSVLQGLTQLGIPKEHIRTERW